MRREFDAESAVLACVLRDSAAYWQVADLLTDEDFQQPDLRALWLAIAKQVRAGSPADPVTIGEQNAGLAGLAIDVARNTAASAANVRTYAELASRRTTERKIKQAGQRIANLTGADVAGEAQRILAACMPRATAHVARIGDFARRSYAQMTERAAAETEMCGVPTGYPELDELTGGWQPGDLIIVAARPSVGKTAFALQSALHAAQQETPVLFHSLEMGGTQLTDRAIAHLGGVNALHIRAPKRMDQIEWSDSVKATKQLDALPMFIDETAGSTVEAIAARARQVDASHRLGLVLVDYLTYIKPPKADTMADAIQEITRALKSLAKEMGVPLILLSQLSRDGEGAPSLIHLRSSGAIEQDADVVVFLHRPDPSDRELIKVTVAKQRNGPLGEFYLRADMAHMRFHPTEYEPPRRPAADGFGSMRRTKGAKHRAGIDD